MVEISKEVSAVTAKEQNTHRLKLPVELDGALNLVEAFLHVVNMQGEVGLISKALYVLKKLGEHLVVATLYHNKDGVGALLSELLGVCVELKTAFFGSAQYNTARCYAYIGVVVQYS